MVIAVHRWVEVGEISGSGSLGKSIVFDKKDGWLRRCDVLEWVSFGDLMVASRLWVGRTLGCARAQRARRLSVSDVSAEGVEIQSEFCSDRGISTESIDRMDRRLILLRLELSFLGGHSSVDRRY